MKNYYDDGISDDDIKSGRVREDFVLLRPILRSELSQSKLVTGKETAVDALLFRVVGVSNDHGDIAVGDVVVCEPAFNPLQGERLFCIRSKYVALVLPKDQ